MGAVRYGPTGHRRILPKGREEGLAYTTETWVSEAGNTVIINRPILSPEEYAQRLELVKAAAFPLMFPEEAARRRMEDARKVEALAERMRVIRETDEELERLNREIDALKQRREAIFKKREGGDE